MDSTNDHVVYDLVVTIINDGNGSQCGLDYNGRKLAAKENRIGKFKLACRYYDNDRVRGGAKHANPDQIDAAAQELLDYYITENKEGEET